MTFTLMIDMESAAFGEGMEGYELARILRKLATDLDGTEITPCAEKVRDINGNTVGGFEVTR